MPKVNLIRDEGRERAKVRRTLIRMKCAERDIPSQAVLARKIGLNESTMSTKINSGAWTADDLRALDRQLRFSAEELARFVRA